MQNIKARFGKFILTGLVTVTMFASGLSFGFQQTAAIQPSPSSRCIATRFGVSGKYLNPIIEAWMARCNAKSFSYRAEINPGTAKPAYPSGEAQKFTVLNSHHFNDFKNGKIWQAVTLWPKY